MPDKGTSPTTRQQERQVVHLVATNLTVGAKPKRTRAPRRKSVKALIETAKRTGLAVKALKPDGTVEIGEKVEVEQPEHGDNISPLDAWRARHAG